MAGIRPGLERIGSLLALLGNPQNHFKTVHVSGTNGKGSTCAFITSALVANGILTGSFNSPHLLTESDAIRINKRIIDQRIYQDARQKVLRANETISASNFEITTAVAFCCFSFLKVQIAVIEVGLGGTLDATNIIPSPLLGVICNIGIDHTEFLGDTVAKIASHKSGIIKTGMKGVVISKQDYETECLPIFQRTAELASVPIHFTEPAVKSGSGCVVHFGNELCTLESIRQGDFQLANVSAAAKALSILKECGLELTIESTRHGLSQASIPGRLQSITTSYGDLLVDGAHNEAGIRNLQKFAQPKYERIYWICAFSGKRESKAFLDTLVRKEDVLTAVTFQQPEGMPWITSQDPKIVLKDFENTIDSKGSLLEALEQAKSLVGYKVIVFGSLYLVAELYRTLNIHDY